jgi:DNA-binding CsgD family transcriptional regulator
MSLATNAVDTRRVIPGPVLAELPPAGNEQGPGQSVETAVNPATERAGGSTELAGRRTEFTVVTALLSDLNAGPEALVIEGEQGIGKTTFLLDVLRWAREMERHIMVARPSNAERVLPFAGLGDLLDEISDCQLDRLPRPQRRALDAVLLRGESVSAELDIRAASLAFLGILREVSEESHVVLGIDDAHWLDSPTAEAISFALRRLGGHRVTLVATCRGDATDLALFRGMRDVPLGRLPLQPLPEESLGELVRSRLAVSIARPMLLEIHRMCRGNPEAGLEVARAVVRNEIARQPGELLAPPASLSQGVRRQLAPLSQNAREALLVAASLDEPTPSLVETALGEGAGTDVEEAVKSGFLQVGHEGIVFPRPLVPSVVYHEASPRHRREVHRVLAEVVTDPARRARHLGLAREEPDSEVAALLERTAAEAAAGGSTDIAADLADLAVRLTPDGEVEDKTKRNLDAASHHAKIGEIDLAAQMLQAICESVEPGPQRSEVLCRLAELMLIRDGPQIALELIDRPALEGPPGGGPTCVIQRQQAAARFLSGDLVGASESIDQAVESSLKVADVSVKAHVSATAAAVTFSLGDPSYRAHLELAAHLASDAEAVDAQLWAASAKAHIASFQDDLPRAQAVVQAARDRTRAAHDDPRFSLFTGRLAEISIWLGDWEGAYTLAADAMQGATSACADALQSFLMYTCALVDAHRGRVERARHLAAQGQKAAAHAGLAPWVALNAGVQGYLELVLGNPDSATEHFRPLLNCHLLPGSEAGLLRLVPDAVEVLSASGDVTRAEQLVTGLEEAGRVIGARWPSASAARCHALIAAAKGDLLEATQWATWAIERERQLSAPRPLELGRHLLVYGTIARRRKQRRAAAAALAEARAYFETLGAILWLSRAEVDAERLGSRTRERHHLTNTQQRVADLISQGLTNAQISRALFISINTVEDNLKAIYRKLDVHSRSALTYQLVRGVSEPEGNGLSGGPTPLERQAG